jgi:hypothetical protein
MLPALTRLGAPTIGGGHTMRTVGVDDRRTRLLWEGEQIDGYVGA